MTSRSRRRCCSRCRSCMDPNFSRTVVLLCKHSDEGAFGLVVNRPLVTTGRVDRCNLDPPVVDRPRARGLDRRAGRAAAQLDARRRRAGRSRGAARHAASPTASICRRRPTCCGGCSSRIRRRRTRLIVGYSGWGPGSSRRSSSASAWLMSDVDRDLIFNTPPIACGKPRSAASAPILATLQMSRGVH